MGGPGSGRWGACARRRGVEQCPTIDAQQLVREWYGSALPPSLTITELTLELDGHVVTLRLEATVPRYGGRRWWLRCPRCDRRRAKLHRIIGELRCRSCAQLLYASQRVGKQHRWLEEADAIIASLGGVRADGLVYKPKRMRWATFHRLMDAEDLLVRAALSWDVQTDPLFRVRGVTPPDRRAIEREVAAVRRALGRRRHHGRACGLWPAD